MLTKELEEWLDQIPMNHEISVMVEELLEVLGPDHQKILQEIIEWYTQTMFGVTDMNDEGELEVG